MIGANVNKADLGKLKHQLDRLDLKRQEKALLQILSNASLPIRKAAKAKAKSKIKPNSGFMFTRDGETKEILQGTIEKSIGVLKYKRARVPMIDIGYRAKGKYNGWFAHFVDAGTAERTTARGYATQTAAKRGKIKPQNIMQAGKAGIPQAEQKIKKDILRMIKRLSK